MFLKKIILAFLFSFLLLFSTFTSYVSADNAFISSSDVTYEVDNKGLTTVTHNITLENASNDLYATSYSLSLEGTKPTNPKAYEGSTLIPLITTQDGDKTTIRITFSDAVVGKGKQRRFSLSFQDSTLATKTGEVWEITIPKLSDPTTYDSYTVTLITPPSLGIPAYISPNPTSKAVDPSGKNIFSFSKDVVSKSGVTAAFGQFQVFSFNLVYHLENPLAVRAQVDIAIPPDTAYQKVNYTSVSPTPRNVTVDSDGNWMANFLLGPRQRVDVKVEGAVQLFAQPRQYPATSPSILTQDQKETDVWQTSDPLIRNLATRLKTPRAIYDYVTSNLSYNYSRVTPNVERLGASAALKDPKNAICTEFTDAFIAIARAAGIPAREINGFAYTENPQIQPLSLVSDVLHAWPEYWDQGRQAWIPVDPTWGSTTGGVDYFTKLDLRHFTFVIHGADSKKPYPPGSYKLGPNPQKDVYVAFGQLPSVRTSTPSLSLNTVREFPFANMLLTAKISNPGPTAIYNQEAQILFDGKVVQRQPIGIIPPYANYEIPVTVAYSFLAQSTPSKVSLVLGTTRKEVQTYKTGVIISNLAVILIAIFVITFLIYVRFVKNRLSHITDRKTS